MITKATGAVVEGLYECVGQPGTQIVNTSDAVWFVEQPAMSYWSPADDAKQPLTVQLFRAGLRAFYTTQQLAPKPTVEPGETATLSQPFPDILVAQSPEQQAAWQAASLVVDTAQAKLQARARAILVDDSKTREAVVTCVENGYRAGKSFADAPDQGDLVGQLELGLGLEGNVAACANAIDAAANESTTPGETITVADLSEFSHEATWEEQANNVLEEATRAFEAAAHRG